ncbi:MAG TPA: hypothetical protein VNJ11_07245 [Bryobacteraceae bacterium]|nr:hypothetical protein [Bryobacteraceae bacterium]
MAPQNKWKEIHCNVRFLTPAFLGDAEQKARWRTPPFKALLRQWWRVAFATKHQHAVTVAQIRQAEGRLFGNAWLQRQDGGKTEADFSRSLVRLRLDDWSPGRLQRWGHLELANIEHPEVTKPVKIGSHLYLGYGPLLYSGGTKLKRAPAINAGEVVQLRLAVPEQEEEITRCTLQLMHLYATAGGRSRNGWGSFVLEPVPGTSAKPPIRNWRDALQLDWAHAIGQDDKGPLIWQTAEAYKDWRELMRDLAVIRIAVRTQFSLTGALTRHWLAYPVTGHSCALWNATLRLPNSLRFKVRPSPENASQQVGVIFHMPCLPPEEFRPDQYKADIERVWQQVHWLLDELTKDTRSRSFGACIQDNKWLQKVQPQLANILLKRIRE